MSVKCSAHGIDSCPPDCDAIDVGELIPSVVVQAGADALVRFVDSLPGSDPSWRRFPDLMP